MVVKTSWAIRSGERAVGRESEHVCSIVMTVGDKSDFSFAHHMFKSDSKRQICMSDDDVVCTIVYCLCAAGVDGDVESRSCAGNHVGSE
jgi:hypothetical protein